MSTYTVLVDAPDTTSESAVIVGVQNSVATVVPNLGAYLLEEVRNPTKLDAILLTFSDLTPVSCIVIAMQLIVQLDYVLQASGDSFFGLGVGSPLAASLPPSAASGNSKILGLESDAEAVVDQLLLWSHRIQFIGEPFNPTATALTVDIPIRLTDADGNTIVLSENTEVRVDITDSSAPDAQVVSGGLSSPVDGSLVVPVVTGAAEIQVVATGTGFVDLGLTDTGSTGLNVSNTARVIFS